MSIKAAVIAAAIARQPAEVNELGNAEHRGFWSTDRYVIDFADDFKAEGWQQYDTSQDAHYFGVWTNKKQLRTLTYAEGDWTLTVCEDVEHYNAEIQAMNEFYDDGFVAKTLDDDGTWTTYRQDREAFFIGSADLAEAQV